MKSVFKCSLIVSAGLAMVSLRHSLPAQTSRALALPAPLYSAGLTTNKATNVKINYQPSTWRWLASDRGQNR
jgi:hypothetical protein